MYNYLITQIAVVYFQQVKIEESIYKVYLAPSSLKYGKM